MTAFGAAPAHYDVVGKLLLETMAQMAGSEWSPEVAGAWETAYSWVAGTMIGTEGRTEMDQNIGGNSGQRNGHSEYPRIAKAEDEALKKRVAELESQVNGINKVQAVIEFDLSGNVLTANQNFLNVLGYSLDEIKGRHRRMFVEPSVAASQEYVRFWADLVDGRAQTAEYKRIAKGGREVWIQASYNPIFDGNGRVTKFVKFATDVTATKLQSLEQKQFAQMVDAAPINIMYCDLDLTIKYMNATSRATLTKLEAYLPIRADRMVGASIDIFHKAPAHQRRLLADPKNLPHRANITVGPETLSLLVTARYDEDGRYIGPMLTWEVITEKRALEKAASDAAARETAVATDLKTRVDSILEVVTAAARGDLTRTVSVAGDDAVGKMATSLSQFFATMRTSISGIAGNATSLGAASEELSVVSRQMTGNCRRDGFAGERRLGGRRAGEPEHSDGGHWHRGDVGQHPGDRQERV